MDREWNDNQPIYRQLRDRVVAMILDGVLKEGDPLPSVRNVAAEYRVNPLTVLKGYQELVNEELVEKRRGLGMFVKDGARNLLLRGERQKFLVEEWPRIHATIQRLGLKAEELLDGANHRSSSITPSARLSRREERPSTRFACSGQAQDATRGSLRFLAAQRTLAQNDISTYGMHRSSRPPQDVRHNHRAGRRQFAC